MQSGFPVGMPVSFLKKAHARLWGIAAAIGLSLVLASSARAQTCTSDEECDDLSNCTTDTCPAGTCVFTLDLANCDDGAACTVDTCVAGSCRNTPDDALCDDGVDCTTDTCFSGGISAFCQNVTNCSDDIFCNGQETCCITPEGCGATLFGQCSLPDPPMCVPGTFCDPIIDACIECNDSGDCDDGNDCTDDVCDVNFDCQNPPFGGGTSCDDGDACTINDQCNGTTDPDACDGTTVVCDRLVCQRESCNSSTGLCDYTPLGDGTNCNPDDTCFPGGECDGGVCIGAPGRGCIDIFFQTQATPAVVGDIIEVDLMAQYNDTPECAPPPSDCSAGTHPVASISAVFTWDKDVLQLTPSTPPTFLNPEDPCDDGASCAGNCVPLCYECGQPSRQYDWSTSGYPNDCAPDKDAINSPCDFPANDGDGLYLSFVAFTCDHDNDPGTPVVAGPPACVASAFPFHVTTLKFLAIGPTAGTIPDTAIAIEDCILQTRSAVLSGSAGDDVRGSVGTPVTVEVQCVNDNHCGSGSTCTNGVCQSCLPPVVVVEGSRYIAVTPLEGPPEVAILVSGTDPGTSCMLGYAGMDGRVNPNIDPNVQPENAFKAPGPAGWGTAHIRGEGIVGDQTYEVRLDCDRANPGTSLSDPVTVTMWVKGKVTDTLSLVDISDPTKILDGFRGLFDLDTDCTSDADCVGQQVEKCDLATNKCFWFTRENVDMKGDTVFCRPDRSISIGDVTISLNFFRGLPDVCDLQCP